MGAAVSNIVRVKTRNGRPKFGDGIMFDTPRVTEWVRFANRGPAGVMRGDWAVRLDGSVDAAVYSHQNFNDLFEITVVTDTGEADVRGIQEKAGVKEFIDLDRDNNFVLAAQYGDHNATALCQWVGGVVGEYDDTVSDEDSWRVIRIDWHELRYGQWAVSDEFGRFDGVVDDEVFQHNFISAEGDWLLNLHLKVMDAAFEVRDVKRELKDARKDHAFYAEAFAKAAERRSK